MCLRLKSGFAGRQRDINKDPLPAGFVFILKSCRTESLFLYSFVEFFYILIVWSVNKSQIIPKFPLLLISVCNYLWNFRKL